MLDVSKRTTEEKTLARAFEAGFENASLAFARMANAQVIHEVTYSCVNSLDQHFLMKEVFDPLNVGKRVLLTTDVFGDLTGKSYLLFSAADFDLITRAIPTSSSTTNLKEEFLKELDNILSAAVITKISNEMKKTMYGDIPILVGEVKSQTQELIGDDFQDQMDELYVTLSTFSMSGAKLHFLWVVDFSGISVSKGNRT